MLGGAATQGERGQGRWDESAAQKRSLNYRADLMLEHVTDDGDARTSASQPEQRLCGVRKNTPCQPVLYGWPILRSG